MRLVKPSYKIIEQEPGTQGIYKQIELAARNCYKSDPVEGITPKDFVDRMIKRGHLSTLEHGTVYLKIPCEFNGNQWNESWKESKYKYNPYSRVRREYIKDEGNYFDFVTTNYRVLVENSWLNDLKYLCEPTEFHEKRVTVKFTSNIHFYKDLTRHRKMSFAIESTRYCNYSKDKFSSELTFITPVWIEDEELGWSEDFREKLYDSCDTPAINFCTALKCAETTYLKVIEQGWTAQQAAEVLPQATKADIIVTGFVSDWQHIFNLRTSIIAATGKPHPEVSRLMDPLYEEFKTKNLL